MKEELLKKTIKEAAPSLGKTFLILGAILLFHPPFLWLLAGFLLLQLSTEIYKAAKQGWVVGVRWGWRLVTNSATLIAFILFIYLLTLLFGGWGLLGLVIVCSAIAGWIIYKKWDTYLFWIREIEKMIFGETMEERRKRKWKN